MNELTKFDPQTLRILAESFKDGIPLPGVKEIFLIESYVAGTSYLDLKEVEKQLEKQEFLKLVREPTNQYDALAILIYDSKGNKLGYVPRAKNEVLARLMDAGKLIFGRLVNKEYVGNWLKITVQIFLKDL
ncbi:MAG: HIRAN domain-containing protein [Leptospiraceae bacterium]|nr:HIRAN domain-containing protein [Leptospiraceae bacterium]